MNHLSGAKKLKLHKETLRRVTRGLSEHQLANVLGGVELDGGPNQVTIPTVSQHRSMPDQ